ncbi:hypothetical protein DMNBHIDG_01769 [Candidatus Methanoperedenaceae archaeon GB37]|nr:hypothetical protein DMNBHIDG_01769 [Candidatus Methanoperedenaceae archaeon GB37]
MVKATTVSKCQLDLEFIKDKLQTLFGKEVVIGTHTY